MGLSELAKDLNGASDEKETTTTKEPKLFFDSAEFWMEQSVMRSEYHDRIFDDLETALDQKLEQELWTNCFRKIISQLQEISRDRENPRRHDARIELTWFLDTAFGFYLDLLQEICLRYDLQLPYLRSRSLSTNNLLDGIGASISATQQLLPKPERSSCVYICEYCLVHLGDLARYRAQKMQAASFYKQANRLSPTNGQPYNQLALLEASSNNKLGTAYYYVRSIAVKNPFSVAVTNLRHTLQSTFFQRNYLYENDIRFNTNDYMLAFLQIQHCLSAAKNLTEASLLVNILNEKLTALVATQSFNDFRLIQFFVINLYTLSLTNELALTSSSSSSSPLSALSPSSPSSPLIVRNLVLELLIGSLSACLLPTHTLDISNEDFLSYQALPVVKLTLEWIRLNPEILREPVFESHLQIWPTLVQLLNALWKYYGQDFVQKCADDLAEYATIPLPEDRNLIGFLPLQGLFMHLKTEQPDKDLELLNTLRAYRLVELGEWFANEKKFLACERNGKFMIKFSLLETVAALPADEKREEEPVATEAATTKVSRPIINVAIEGLLKKAREAELKNGKVDNEEEEEEESQSNFLFGQSSWADLTRRLTPQNVAEKRTAAATKNGFRPLSVRVSTAAIGNGRPAASSSSSGTADNTDRCVTPSPIDEIRRDFLENGNTPKPIKSNDCSLTEFNLEQFNRTIDMPESRDSKAIFCPHSKSSSLESEMGDSWESLEAICREFTRTAVTPPKTEPGYESNYFGNGKAAVTSATDTCSPFTASYGFLQSGIGPNLNPSSTRTASNGVYRDPSAASIGTSGLFGIGYANPFMTTPYSPPSVLLPHGTTYSVSDSASIAEGSALARLIQSQRLLGGSIGGVGSSSSNSNGLNRT